MARREANKALQAYYNGSEEIKMLLDNECDVIYECKVCRNIFRSLANLISHKRTYCKIQFNSAQHFHFHQNDQDISTIIEHSDVDSNKESRDSKEHVRDLGGTIDRLMQREQKSQMITLSDLYDQASQNLTQDEVIEKKQILQLDKISNSEVAVYQTLKKDDGDSIKKEVNEIHMMENVGTVLGPDGKVSTGTGTGNIALKLDSMQFACKICSRKFVTEKTLKVHIKAKHIPSTYVYPCNACPRTFLLPSGLIRHLRNDHNKSMRRIRLMRESIFKRQIRKDKVKSKGTNRKLAGPQNSKRGKRPANGNSNDLDSNNLNESAESFMAMLKREKEIQANVQKCIDEEEVQMIGSDENCLLGNDELPKNDSVEVVEKNKRKRSFVRKVIQPAGDISLNLDKNEEFEEAAVETKPIAELPGVSILPISSKNSSSDLLTETQSSQMNRPVRNRVKKMSNDYVYGPSNLHRKKAVIKNQKRKLSQLKEACGKENEENTNESLSPKRPYADRITGSTISMAQLPIDNHRACSNKQPEVLSERPIV